MNREEKNALIDSLAVKLADNNVIYLADTSGLTAEETTKLRGLCFKQNTTLTVVKNTLLEKAMQKVEGKDFGDMLNVLSGPTAIMFAETGNAPAKVIQAFRKKSEKPVLKAAFVEEAVYVGDENLQALVDIKSREELIGDIVMLLQSPMKNVVGALQSGGNTISGLVKTLEQRAS